MQTATRTTLPDSPIDDATYNLMMALASKLEAIDVYKKYANDGKNAELWAELARDDRRHADRLLEALRASLTSNR
jgi:rubrerythrin